jgi:hypothetical protein
MNKYHAKPVEFDGIRFDSGREAKRYAELSLLQKAGEIECLLIHSKWPLHFNDILIGTYESDFDYFCNKTGSLIAEDVKGFATDLFKWKWKHVKAEYPNVVWRIIK